MDVATITQAAIQGAVSGAIDAGIDVQVVTVAVVEIVNDVAADILALSKQRLRLPFLKGPLMQRLKLDWIQLQLQKQL